VRRDTSAEDQALLNRAVTAPDSMRSRAMSVAALLTTGIGLIATGFLLAPSAGTPAAALVIGVAALLFLVVSAGLFAAAGLYVGSDEFQPEDLRAKVDDILKRIDLRARWGAGVALLALVLALVAVSVGLWVQRAEHRVSLRLTAAGQTELAKLCPAHAPADPLTGWTQTGPTLEEVRIRIDARGCITGSDGEFTLDFPGRYVSMIEELP
jgi:hypothetical protein